MDNIHQKWMLEALKEAEKALVRKEGPIGAIIIKNNQVIGRGYNQIELLKDPTAHGEIVAIREACRKLNTFNLSGCELYSSCEPCPMCLSAIYWSHINIVYYANNRDDAKKIDFDDSMIYSEIN